MKTISTAMRTHLDGDVTSLATLWRIERRDGVRHFFTDHDQDIRFTVEGEVQVFKASSGYTRSAIANDSSLAVDNLDLQGLLDSDEISDAALRAGAFDYAEVYIYLVNWKAPDDGNVKMRRGRLGEVTQSRSGLFKAELRGMTQLLSQRIGELFTAECRADLGDSRCTVPIKPDAIERETFYSAGQFVLVSTGAGTTQAQYENRIYECTTAGTTASSEPTFDTTVGEDTTDGTAVFTAREAWTRHAVVASVTDNGTFSITVDESRAVDGWFNGGAIAFESGDNEGFVVEVKDWVQSTSTVKLFLAAQYPVQVGDAVRLYPGCDKRLPTCQAKFAIAGSRDFNDGNAKNYRGEPFVPGQDFLLNYPDSK